MYTLYKLILFDDKILKKGSCTNFNSCTCTLYLVVSVLTHPTYLVHVTFYYYVALKLYLLHCCKVQGFVCACVCALAHFIESEIVGATAKLQIIQGMIGFP